MAFPTIPTTAANTLLSSTTSTASTTHTFPSLTTLAPAAGDLIIAIIVQYEGDTSPQFSSWGASLIEILDDSTTGTGNGAVGVAYKIATGSETGTFTVTSVESWKSVNFLMRIPAATWSGYTAPEDQAATRAAGAVADPASFNPSTWDVEDTLWIAVGAHTETSTTGNPPTLDSAPTNFSGALIVARAADTVGDITAGVAFRQDAVAAQDVGTWTTSNAIRGNGIATVIAVRPQRVYTKTGAGVMERTIGPSTHSHEQSRSGVGVAAFASAGKKTVTLNRTGIAAIGGRYPFKVTASGDDGATIGSSATYPPASASTVTDNAAIHTTRRSLSGTYSVANAHLRFDTSALPDDSILVGATLRLYITTINNTDSRNVVGDWANWAPSIDTSDWSLTLTPDAIAGTPLSSLSGNAWNDFQLPSDGGGNISLTSYTYLRLTVDGGEPTGTNSFTWTAWDGGKPPELVVATNGFSGGGVAQKVSPGGIYTKKNDAGAQLGTDFSARANSNKVVNRTGLAQTGNLPFPQFALTVTDDFNRANESPIQSPWDVTGWEPAALVNNIFTWATVWGGAQYGATSYTNAELIVDFLATPPFESSNVGSFGFWDPSPGIFRVPYVNLHQTQIKLGSDVGSGWAVNYSSLPFSSGDSIGVRILGKYVEVWHKHSGQWALVGSWSDRNGNAVYPFLDINDDATSGKTQGYDNFRFAAVTPSALVGDGMKASGAKNVVYSKTGSGTCGFSYVADITANDAAVGDLFGVQSALSRDGSTLVVGAPYEDGAGTDRGAAYVYRKVGGVWTQQAKLVASTPVNNDWLGYSVACSADGSVVAVGVPYSGGSTGKVHVFSGSSWATETILTASDGSILDQFGVAVAVSDDGSKIVVGASQYGTEAGSGAVYVYSGASWATETQILYSGWSDFSGYKFGYSVACSSDASVIAVGAPGEANSQGAIFVYSGSSWATQTYLQTVDCIDGDQFGFAVACSADGSIVVGGAPYNTVSGITDRGAAYIFSGSSWATQTVLYASDGATGDYFGQSVSCSSDGSRVVVSARDNTASGDPLLPGSTYVYDRTDVAAWSLSKKFNPPYETTADLSMGNSVSLSGDGRLLAAGAPQLDADGTGHVFLYDFSGFTGSGVALKVSSGKTGTGIIGTGTDGFKAFGVASKTASKTGVGISERFGSGADAQIQTNTGSAVAAFSATAFKSSAFIKTGIGIAAFTAVGSDEVVYAEAGTGISSFTGGGVGQKVSTGTRMGQVSWAALYIPKSGYATYTKTGAGIVEFAASGAKTVTSSETGAGVAVFSASGTSQATRVKSGTGIAVFTGSGADADTFAETGSGVAVFAASGTRLRERSKTGSGVAVFTASGDGVQDQINAGSGIAVFSASGTRIRERAKTGTGVAVFTASGADADTFAETGAGVAPFSASGSKAITRAKTGTAIAVFTGSAADVDTFAETGTGITERKASGDAASTQARTGAGVAAFVGSGADAIIYSETGAGISARVASGTKALTYAEASAGVAVFTASGSDADTFAETGAGVAPFTASGSKLRERSKTGAGVSAFSGSGADAVTYVEASTGVAVFVGSGADVEVHAETGTGILEMSASGVKVHITYSGTTYMKTGHADSEFTGSGADVDVFTETGSGVLDLTGTGARARTLPRAGSATAVFTGSGADAVVYSETGAGISPRTGSGADVVTSTESGAGVVVFTASGSDVTTSAETGTGTSPFTGSGADAITFVESGAGISARVASGTKVVTYAETGTGIAPFSASGAKSRTFLRTGAGVVSFVAAGTDATTSSETGTGIAPFTVSGAKVRQHLSSGTGVITFTGSGDAATTSSEAGAGVSPFTAAGTRSREYHRTGAGVSPRSAAGDATWTLNRTGAGIIGFVGAGTGYRSGEPRTTGAGVATFAGSGADATTRNVAGSTTAPFTGSGADAVVYAESGAGISERVASGTETRAYLRTGTGTIGFVASGDATPTYSESGAAIAPFTGTGTSAITYAESGAGVIGLTASGAKASDNDKTGTSVVGFSASGYARVDYLRSGTSILVFTVAGAQLRESLRSGTGIIGFAGGGESARGYRLVSGTASIGFIGFGDDVSEFTESGAGVLAFTATVKKKVRLKKGYGRGSTVLAQNATFVTTLLYSGQGATTSGTIGTAETE